jgi:hypothetical protein
MFPSKTALAKQPRAVGIGGCAAQVSAPLEAAAAGPAVAAGREIVDRAPIKAARATVLLAAVLFMLVPPGYGPIEIELDASSWTIQGARRRGIRDTMYLFLP